MRRMQIYLPEDLHRELVYMGKQEEKPTAEIIRTLLHAGVTQKEKRKKKNAGDTLLALTKLGMKGPGDLSTNLFDYLYGEKSDYARGRKK